MKTLTLTAEEEASLRQLLDAALRQAGLAALPAVHHFLTKIAGPPAAGIGQTLPVQQQTGTTNANGSTP